MSDTQNATLDSLASSKETHIDFASNNIQVDRKSTAFDTTTNANVVPADKDNSSQFQQFRIIGSYIIIWLDPHIDIFEDDTANRIIELRHVVHSLKTFIDPDECIDFITNIKYEKVFMILSDDFDQQFILLIENISQIHSIYIYSHHDRMNDKQWINERKKIKGIFTKIESICDTLQQHVYRSNRDLMPISIVSTNTMNLDELDQSFMYSQILKEIILELEYNENAKKDFVDFCNEQYAENDRMLKIIKDFEETYDRPSPIYWYTKETFIYGILNKALRTQDIEIIMKMGFIMRDIHRQIELLHSKMNQTQTITVYRGQALSKIDFEKLKNNKGGLLSFNNFLSTSQDFEVSFILADSIRSEPDLIGILFQIEIDPSISSISFASLDNISHFDSEKEILFSMHTIFRIQDSELIGDRLWKVNLVLTNDNDQQLKLLTDYIRNDIRREENGWSRMAALMLLMGEFDKAIKIYNTIIDGILKNHPEEFVIPSNITYENLNQPQNVIEHFRAALLSCKKMPQDEHQLLYSSRGKTV